MSVDFERNLEDFLFFGGEMPNLAQGVQEVPMPDGFYVCLECKKVSNYYPFGGVCGACEAKAELQGGDR